jgi:hypothetical protein
MDLSHFSSSGNAPKNAAPVASTMSNHVQPIQWQSGDVVDHEDSAVQCDSIFSMLKSLACCCYAPKVSNHVQPIMQLQSGDVADHEDSVVQFIPSFPSSNPWPRVTTKPCSNWHGCKWNPNKKTTARLVGLCTWSSWISVNWSGSEPGHADPQLLVSWWIIKLWFATTGKCNRHRRGLPNALAD